MTRIRGVGSLRTHIARWLVCLLVFGYARISFQQNVEGQIIASQYGTWRVQGFTPNTYAGFAPASCNVLGGSQSFPAFVVGTPIKIFDGNPSLNEVVTPTSVSINQSSCGVSIAPVNNHQVPFYLASATGGLQEALNNNLNTPATNMVILDNAFYQSVGSANVQAIIAAAKGGVSLNLVDITTTPYNFYAWDVSKSQYELVPNGNTGPTVTGCQVSALTGINTGYACPTNGVTTNLASNQLSTDTTIALASTTGFSPTGCFFLDSEYECYTGISANVLTGLVRGAYTTTAAAHTSGVNVASVPFVLGAITQIPFAGVAYGNPGMFFVNASTPPQGNGPSGKVVFQVNSGNNGFEISEDGNILQNNTGQTNRFQGPVAVGTLVGSPNILSTGFVLQTNGPNSAYSPLTLGGGHMGSLNVVKTTNIPAGIATLINAPPGSSTVSYICAGTDFDGNLIPGTTFSLTNAPATLNGGASPPQSIQVICPWVAGVNTYQIYRTAGGPSQGLLASGTGPGFGFEDSYDSTTSGTPPASNGSNPHISVQGTGIATITLGAVTIATGVGAPTSTCGTAPNGSGSLWLRQDGGASTSVYSCAGTTWTPVTIP